MDITLNSQQIFPVGTTVKAYPSSNWPQAQLPPTGAPVGVSTAEAVVGLDGAIALTALSADVVYYAAAQVGGVWRYVRVTPLAPTASGSKAEIEALRDEIAVLDTVASGLSLLETKVASSALLSALFAEAHGVPLEIMERGVQLGAAAGINTYGLVPNFAGQSVITGNQAHAIKYLDPARYAIDGKKTRYRLDVQALCNTKAPGVNIAVELLKVIETAGATGINGIPAGTAVAVPGLAPKFEALAAKSLNHKEAVVDAPAAGFYMLVATTSLGATAAESLTDITATLSVEHEDE